MIDQTAFDAMMKDYEDAIAVGNRELANAILNTPTPTISNSEKSQKEIDDLVEQRIEQGLCVQCGTPMDVREEDGSCSGCGMI